METALIYIAIFAYSISFCIQLAASIFGKPGIARFVTWAAGAGFIVHTCGLVAWSLRVGHLPVGNMFELNLLGAWITVIIFLVLCMIKREVRVLALAVMPVCFLVIGTGLLAGMPEEPLSPAYASVWLVVHVLFAFLGFGSFVIAFAASCISLARRPRLESENAEKDLQAGWTAKRMEKFIFRLTLFGFISHGVMLASGSVWAKRLWGKFWSWDPIETWSLIVFIAYGAYLHLTVLNGWKGRKAAIINIIAFGLLTFSFWGIQYILPSFHLFEDIGRIIGR